MRLPTNIVEVFKTNVVRQSEANELVEKLRIDFPQVKINFDLHDCDKILRVEGEQVAPQKIIELINRHGYQCQVLE